MSQALPEEDCLLCKSPLRNDVDRCLNDAGSAAMVNAILRHGGFPEVHRNTVSKHRNKHVVAFVRRKAIAIRETVHELGTSGPLPTQRDLAVLARDRGIQRLLDPDDNMDVTMAEALRAQEMLDRRMEKQGDRELTLTLVGVLSGQVQPQFPIEAEYREITAQSE